MKWPRIAVLALLASCATAGGDDDDGIAAPTPDATSGTSFADAARFVDAAPRADATPAISYDATPIVADASFLCNDSSTCGAGECCFALGGFCVAGEEVIGVCVPD